MVNNIREKLNAQYLKISEVRAFIKELEAIEKSDEATKELLNLLYLKEEELSLLYKSKAVNFVPIQNGYLAIGPRPTLEKVDELKNLGVTTIVTLLKETEKNVVALGEYIQSNTIHWLWFPLSASKLLTDDKTKTALITIYQLIAEKLKNKERIFIHCAAGVHRTGAFTNGLLQYHNFSKIESRAVIQKIRAVTAREAVAKHWRWSETIVHEKMKIKY